MLKRANPIDARAIDEAIELAVRESATLIDGDVNVATKALNGHRPGA